MSVIQRKIVNTAKAGLPVGPYNQAVVVNDTCYVSGQIPIDPATSTLVTGDISKQATQVLDNMKEVVTAAGSSMENVVKVTILLTDINDWPKVNEVYEKYFPSKYPARAAYQVSALPKGAHVEMEAIAVVGEINDVD